VIATWAELPEVSGSRLVERAGEFVNRLHDVDGDLALDLAGEGEVWRRIKSGRYGTRMISGQIASTSVKLLRRTVRGRFPRSTSALR
jgi:hypothetical protein